MKVKKRTEDEMRKEEEEEAQKMKIKEGVEEGEEKRKK